jgi:hypothetical protein
VTQERRQLHSKSPLEMTDAQVKALSVYSEESDTWTYCQIFDDDSCKIWVSKGGKK